MTKPVRALNHDPQCTLSLHAIGQLEEARRRTLHWLDGIDSSLLDGKLDGYHNTIGTLLYHIAAVEVSWLFSEILQTDFSADIAALFPYSVRDENGLLTRVSDVTLDEHIERLVITRKQPLNALQGITEDNFLKYKAFKDYKVTDEWIVHHLMQHEAEHRGEMMMIYTLLTG